MSNLQAVSPAEGVPGDSTAAAAAPIGVRLDAAGPGKTPVTSAVRDAQIALSRVEQLMLSGAVDAGQEEH
jgi:hypothetical protein